MYLPKNLISEFVKITNDKQKEKAETTVYGKIVKNGDNVYVRLDGSDILTPVATTTDTLVGERVTVLIKNHTATVTGNITSPAARTGDVQQIGSEVNNLNEENVTIKGKLAAAESDVTDLKTNKLDTTVATATYATIENLDTTNTRIDNLQAEGTSGIWSYRKWFNGRVELFGSYTVSGVSCSNKFGSAMYRSAELTITSFPFSIYEPNLTASYESNGYGAFLWATSTTTETSPPTYYLVRAESGTIDSGKINFHVIGKWTE